MSKSRVAWRTLNLGPKTSQASIRYSKSAPVQRPTISQCDLEGKPKLPGEFSCAGKFIKRFIPTHLAADFLFLAIQHGPIKTVNICTAADVKRKYQKEANEENKGQPGKKPVTVFGLMRKLLVFGLKVVIVGNTLCLMWDAGVWGDSYRSEELVNMILKSKGDEDKEEEILEAGVSFLVLYNHWGRGEP